MNNNLAFIEHDKKSIGLWLALLLLAALAVRLYGIRHGLPYGYQIDEKFIVNHAIGFGTGDLNPHVFHWPGTSLMYLIFAEYGLLFAAGYCVGAFGSPSDFAAFFINHPTIFYLIGRVTMAVLGTLTVFLVYRLGKRVYGASAGLAGAALFAFGYLAVGLDHFTMPDTLLTFLWVVGMILAYRIMISGSISAYLWCGAVIGVAVATKYNGAALILPLILAHVFGIRKEQRGWTRILADKRLLWAGVMVAVGFILLCPFSVLDFSTFSQDLLWQFRRVHAGSFGVDVDNALVYYVLKGLPRSTGIMITIVSIVGWGYALVRHKHQDILLGGLILFYLGYIGSWKVGVDKYLLPILPFLAILAGRFLTELFAKFRLSPPVAKRYLAVTVLVLLAEPLAHSIYNDYLLTQKDTRTQAKEWIEDNIPAGSHIALDSGNFDAAKFSPPLNDSVESLQARYEQLEKDFPETWAASKDKITQYLKIRMEYQEDAGYTLTRIVHNNTNQNTGSAANLKELAKNNVAYIVASSYAYDVYKDPLYIKRNPEMGRYYSDYYDSLDDQCRLLKTFQPLTAQGPGPVIKIYQRGD